MIRRPMSAVTDVNRGDVGVEDDGEEAGGGGSSGGDSADPGQTRLDALKDSVVARLLLDNRPPGLHTVACSSTTRRSSSGSDAVPRLRQLQPVVDLSAGIPVSILVAKNSIFFQFNSNLHCVSKKFPPVNSL